MLNKREDARVLKPNGEVLGPYKALFTGSTIIIDDRTADIQEGDVVLRLLPSGKDERSVVTQATFYSRPIAGVGEHYQLKFRKGEEVPKKPEAQSIHIHNAQSVQVGDHNTQNVVNMFQALAEKIENSNASPAEKGEAKSRLRAFLENPLVNTLIGVAASAILL